MYVYSDDDDKFYELNTSELVGWDARGSTYGWAVGGSAGPSYGSQIQRFPFVASTNATDVGDLTVRRWKHGGSSSSTHAYTHAGHAPPSPASQSISKFNFASVSTQATLSGTVHGAYEYMAGNQSETHGFAHGGWPTRYNITAYSFASDTEATESHNSLIRGVDRAAAISGPQYGYVISVSYTHLTLPTILLV